MKRSAKLRILRDNIGEQLQKMIDAAKDGDDVREFTEDEATKYKSLIAEFDRLDAEYKSALDGEQRIELVDAAAASDDAAEAKAAADPAPAPTATKTAPELPGDTPLAADAAAVDPNGGDAKGVIKSVAFATQVTPVELDVQQRMALAMWANYQSKRNPRFSQSDMVRSLGLEAEAAKFDFAEERQMKAMVQERSLSPLVLTEGGHLIPNEYSESFIEWLYNEASILRAQPRVEDLSAGNLKIPGGNASASASYRAVKTDLAYSQASFRDVNLSAKYLGAVTAVTQELLDQSPLPVANLIVSDLQQAFILAMDLAALRGDGTGDSPTGLLNRVNAANKVTAAVGTNPTIEAIDILINQLFAKLDAANIPMGRRVWFMSPRIKRFLATRRGTGTQYAYPEMRTQTPVFHGHPVFITNQIPENLGAGTNEAELYLCNMEQFIFGDAKRMSLLITNEGSYFEGGQLRSTFSRNEVAVRLTGAHDFNIRHDKAAGVISGLQWMA